MNQIMQYNALVFVFVLSNTFDFYHFLFAILSYLSNDMCFLAKDSICKINSATELRESIP